MDVPQISSASSPSRLDSWKEIAAYLKRDVRTVQRWEKEEGLPIHRLQHGKQGSVYAQPVELDAWWDSRRRELESAGIARSRFEWRHWAAIVGVPLLLLVGWLLGRLPSVARSSAGYQGTRNVFEFPVVLSDNAGFGLDVSPDGRRIAYDTWGSPPQIFVHDLSSRQTRAVRGTERGYCPTWSPDGSRLLFTADGKLKIVDLLGGPVVTLADATAWPSAASWRADGLILFSNGADILRVPSTGGTAERVPIEDGARGMPWRGSPRWLPDNRHFIYHLSSSGLHAEYVGSVDSPQASRLVETEYPAIVAQPFVLFLRGTSLMAQRLDGRMDALTGEPMFVAADVAPGSLSTRARFAASDTGVLAFAGMRGGRAAELTWFDRSQRETGTIPQPDGVDYLNPSISPDGRFVAVNRMDPQSGNWDIWIVDLERNIPSRATFDPAGASDAVWSPDSRQIVYVSNRGGQVGLYRKTIGTDGEDRLTLAPEVERLLPSDWSPDGRFIVFTVWKRSGTEVRALQLDGNRQPEVLVSNIPLAYGARISPDGRWMAYSSFETGSSEIYVQPFHAAGEKRQISSGGGVHPRWTADGREIVYWAVPKGLSSVTLTRSRTGFTAAAPHSVLDVPVVTLLDSRPHWDMTRDGRLFLIRRATGALQPSITVVVNWFERLKLPETAPDPRKD